MRDWNSSVVLYRLATEQVDKAEQYASKAGSSVRGQQPEIDSCIATLVLVQAALEAWINWTAGQVGVTLSRAPLSRWEQECALIAKKAERPPPPPLSKDDRRFLQTLRAWRNYLLHGDDPTRERLAELGLGREGLGASLARETLRNADAVFEYSSSATGGEPLRSEFLWSESDG